MEPLKIFLYLPSKLGPGINKTDLKYFLFLLRNIGTRRIGQFRFFVTIKDQLQTDFNSKEKHSNAEYEENTKKKILEESLKFVGELGWSRAAISKGAESLGYPGITNGVFSNSEADLINFFNKKCNQELVVHMERNSFEDSLKVKDKNFIEEAIKKRLSMIIPYINHWPQALGIMSLPPNVKTSLKNFLCLIDDICYYSGDKSVDFSWYSRRFAVSGIYKASELCLIQDKSEEHKETWRFLNRRIEEVFYTEALFQDSAKAASTTGKIFWATLTTAQSILRLNQT